MNNDPTAAGEDCILASLERPSNYRLYYKPQQFRNEIIWQRTSTHNDGKQYGRIHDTILFYSKSDKRVWNPVYTELDPAYKKKKYRYEDERGIYRIDNLYAQGVTQKGESGRPWRGVNPSPSGNHWRSPRRGSWPSGVEPPENYESLSVHEKLEVLDAKGLIHWPEKGNIPGFKRYLSTSKGRRVQDIMTDIKQLGKRSPEKTDYPTQKPIELYKRLVAASSKENGLVLDPFCGCGTTLMAAEAQNRHWIGIDVTYLATGAVKLQIEKIFPQLRNEITITGTPENAEQALELADTNSQGFEEWCVTHILKFKSNAKKVGDRGIDGRFTFPLGKIRGKQAYGRAVAQVKGGNYALGHIRDFRTAMRNEEADVGVFVVTRPPSRGMLTEAAKAGTYKHPSYDLSVPVLQIYEIQNYFRDTPPKLPFGERAVL